MNKLPLYEKVGYAMGDAGANLVWRGALAYLAVFYTDTFGISAAAAAMLFLVVRLSDGVTDIIMGMIADRTQSRFGKFRPWILYSAPFLGLFMVLCFTTPDFSTTNKLIYAYVTYIGLTLAYTVSNVPYSALMGVMTPDDTERTKLSGFRFAGAFTGGLLVMGFLPELVAFFGGGDNTKGYQLTMYLFASLLIILMIITFATTKERVTPHASNEGNLKSELFDLTKSLPFIILPLLATTLFFYYRDLYSGVFFALVMAAMTFVIKKLLNKDKQSLTGSQRDMVDLLTNKPWLVLLGIGFLTMMFNGIKYGVIAYYFKYHVANELMAGQYFIALLVVSIFGALATGKLAEIMGKRNLFIASLMLSGILTTAFYWVPSDNLVAVFTFGCAAEFFAAMMPTLFFSMLGDSADYSEWKNKRRATGLIYSAGTFVQKTGGGFAGALVLVVLAGYGYNGMDELTITQALPGMQLLMSWIPAAFAFLGAALMLIYPLTSAMTQKITEDLAIRRSNV
ncbi:MULTISPECIES: MFS transporter [unclassified Pseudoalteromonas]|uniref:MFS transporter n=1 Tax=unclassified Pseudoalteromonas TaxID=194690 RepID=UPI0015FE3D62|nr:MULTISPECIES: MFS transporter [unclassified Pseudoalteromonas]MBB1338624.1 MFS transporter [Pseudoalteromonas sp. SR44-2]MBB1376979.1 MFS transporter [Pseudoalteromonas sp. SR43-2]